MREAAESAVSTEQTTMPTVGELRRLVKKRERRRFSAMWFLEPIQAYVSYVLIRLHLNSLQVTVLWLVVALAGYAVTAIGTPSAFIGGCLLLYLKTILDGCDGEVARFHKQFVSEREDLETFIHGVYLDKAFHIIEKPLWGLSLAFGLYRMTGEPWIFAAGVSLAVFHGFCRHNGTLQKDIPRQFADRARAVFGNGEDGGAERPDHDSLPVRAMDKLFFLMRNGKYFNLFVLMGATLDSVLLWNGRDGYGVFGLVATAGMLSPVLMAYVISRVVASKSLLRTAVEIGRSK